MINDYKFNQSLDKKEIGGDQSVRTKFQVESRVLSCDPCLDLVAQCEQIQVKRLRIRVISDRVSFAEDVILVQVLKK